MSRRWATLDARPTRVIAHRGASGPLPEHCEAAYALALQQGADLLEPDLVPSRDGVLMVRHDRGLRRSTDVAAHASFAARQRDGDWQIDEFLRSELATLRAVQPFAARDRSHDGRHALLDFRQLLAWADAQARALGRPVPLYPELKHPRAFEAVGLDVVAAFVDAISTVDQHRVPLWLQCFDPATLQRVRGLATLPLALLLDADADWQAALREQCDGLRGVGVAKASLLRADGSDSGLVARAHARGLQVHAWTYRDDLLPPGVEHVEQELEVAFALGVDAVFCDFPATGLACRDRFARP